MKVVSLAQMISLYCQRQSEEVGVNPVIDVRHVDEGIQVTIAENVGPILWSKAAVVWGGGDYHGPLSSMPA